MRFSQYLLAAAGVVGLVAAAPAEKINKRVSKLKFFGINESGPEFGTAIPGTLNKDYVWPNVSTFPVRLFSEIRARIVSDAWRRASPARG